MIRRLVLRFAAPLLFGLAVGAPAVHAQGDKIPRAADQDHAVSGDEEGSGRVPAKEYAVAGLLGLSVLVIVCMPSRKN